MQIYDGIAPPAYGAHRERTPRARLGHLPPVERPDEAARVVRGFLA
jgi:hypothetical protein